MSMRSTIAAFTLGTAILVGSAMASDKDDACRLAGHTFAPGMRLNVGQGVYIVPASPVIREQPYALTGSEQTGARSDSRGNPLVGRWIDAGQSRLFVADSR